MKTSNKRHVVPVIAHPAFTEALELAYTHVSRADAGTLMLLVGMSGAGKNTVAEELERRLSTRHPALREGDKPLVKLLAVNTNNSFYSSKDSMSRLVDALEDPFRSTDRGQLLAPFGVKTHVTSHRAVPESTLRRTATRLLVARNTRYLLVDEADMMCVIKRSGRDAADHLENWRLLALETGVVIVLLATYRILTIWDRTSQFTRKMPTVHVRRYARDTEDDIRDFVGVLNQLCEIFRIEADSIQPILAQAAAILAASGGIFGQLLALFQRADDIAEAAGRASLNVDDLRASLPRKHQVDKLWAEIVDGEARLQSSDFESVCNAAKLASTLARGRRSSATGRLGPVRSTAAPGAAAPRRKRGRPKGSKNRRPVKR
jgi:hypothetical protein